MRPARLVLAALACASLAMPAAAASRATFLQTVTAAQPPGAAHATAARPDTAPFPYPIDPRSLVDSVTICPHTGCGTGPVCADDSIMVWIEGRMPNDCWSIDSVQVWWPPIVTIRPIAPWVRVFFEDGACSGRVCSNEPRPWLRRVMLPPLPEGPYTLGVVPMVTSCLDSVPPSPTLYWAFDAVPCGSDTVPPRACFIPWFPHEPGWNGCDATLSPSTPATITFGVITDVPVGGVQADLTVSAPGIPIIAVDAVEAGWAVRWAATPTGARVIAFRTRPILAPAIGFQPLVRVRLAVRPGVTIPDRVYVTAGNAIAADPAGADLPQCPVRSVPSAAVLCAAPDCDANGDGRTDVRDLVLEVRCLRDSLACARTFDCNGDGRFSLDDVLCCASQILRIAPCTNCPPDSTPLKDVGVRIAVGIPQAAAGEVHVPIRITAADRVGAARLALPIPADRWRVVGVDCADPAWLTLADGDAGQALIGAIRIGAAVPASEPSRLDLTLRLEPVGGASGGELGTLTADVSGADGAKLLAPVDGPVRPLPGGVSVELSANRPDPFRGTTRFTLSLPVAASVDLGVFDLHGRRVTTLRRGVVAAGVTEFAWDGRADGGSRVGAGVYFYRCAANGRTLTRRMVYLGGN